ncbi:MAG: metallophosphoesterase family protein [Chitinophaga sp.]
MTIALFSDIHANLPALEACFKHLDSRRPDAVYCLGDLVGYNIWPNEVIREIRRRGISVIAGNYDHGIGRNGNDCGCAYKTEEEKNNGAVSISYTNKTIGEEERQYLRTLPAHIRIDFQLNDRTTSLLLVHGSPRRINEYLFEDRDEKSMLRILQDANADILCFGHTHKPYHRLISDGERTFHAINTGSVGKPKDGDPRGCYVLLTITENKIETEFVRFEYDVEKAAGAVEKSVLPDAYAESLRKGS